MFQARACVFVLFAACAATTSSDLSIDLSQQGVSAATVDGDEVILLDANRHPIGSVHATTTGIDITLRGTDAALSWDDSAGWVRCGQTAAVIARQSLGTWEIDPTANLTMSDALPSAACTNALEVGRRVGELQGVVAPWQRDDLAQASTHEGFWEDQAEVALEACTNVSTYVYMAGCDACFSHACYAAFGSGGWSRCNQSGGSTCSAGMFVTTCNITYCN
jgi:hypothetical protein